MLVYCNNANSFIINCVTFATAGPSENLFCDSCVQNIAQTHAFIKQSTWLAAVQSQKQLVSSQQVSRHKRLTKATTTGPGCNSHYRSLSGAIGFSK